MDAFAVVCLPHLLRHMAREHSDLDISVMVDNSHALTRKLDDGELDVAVVSTPSTLPGLRYEALGEQMIGWIGGPPSETAVVEDTAWVAASRIFVTPPPSNLDALTNEWFRTAGRAPPRLSVCHSVSAIVGLIQAGTGIGVLPLPLVANGLAAGVMRRLTVPGPRAAQAIFVIYNKGVLDTAIPDTLKAVRMVAEEQGFCG